MISHIQAIQQTVSRWRGSLACLAISVSILGCATGEPETPLVEDEAPAAGVVAQALDNADVAGEITAPDELTAELLYDLLLASIARQRNENEVSLDALSRAAYLSRDKRVVNEAMRLAVRMKDFHRVIELSRLMEQVDAGNYRNRLALANAQLETGNDEEAFDILVALALEQRYEDIQVLQSIAALLARHHPQSMLEQFGERLESQPSDARLSLVHALLASRLERETLFLGHLDETLALQPDWEIAAILKLTSIADEDAEKMTAYATTFLERNPDARRFRVQYGRLLIQANHIDQSLVELETVLDQDPDASDALFASGLIYYEKGDLELARERLAAFVTLNPSNDQSRLYLADIEYELGDTDRAADWLQQIESQEHYIEAQIRLASLIAELDGVEAGIRQLRQVEAANEEEYIQLILEQDLLYRQYDSPDHAKEVLDKGLEKIPDHPDLLYNRGLLAAQMNLLELHERDMRELIRQQPENAHAYNALGYTLADQTDRYEEAMGLITRAMEMLPDDPFILDSMGWINFRIGNTDEAIEYLRRALGFRQDAEIAAHLGEVLWIAGDRQEAREIWEKGRQWSPDNATLLDTIERFSDDSSWQPGIDGYRFAGAARSAGNDLTTRPHQA